MARGDNPNSRANLIVPTSKQARELGRKGGKRSAAVKKEYKTFQECFKAEMTPEMREELFNVLYKRSKAGNLKAIEILRDTMGEKPTDKVVVQTIDDEVITGLKEAIEKRRNNG